MVRALYAVSHAQDVRLFQSELMAKPVPPQADSGKLRNRLIWIAKHKFTNESQKLDTRRRGENLNAKSNIVSRATTYIFCILCLYNIQCDTRKASENLNFILEQSLILSSVCVIIVTRPICDSITQRLDKVQ